MERILNKASKTHKHRVEVTSYYASILLLIITYNKTENFKLKEYK